jgi:Spy/CpxP family protein refolding chaperone
VKILVAGLTVISLSFAYGQTVPSDKSVLENAEGAGMGMYGEMNGFPGPKHVLELQDKLALTEQQAKDIEAVYDDMREGATVKGEVIISKEQELYLLFTSGKATEGAVNRLSAEIGKLRGELRAIHLIAHLRAKDILTPGQVRRYMSLRQKQTDHPHTK